MHSQRDTASAAPPEAAAEQSTNGLVPGRVIAGKFRLTHQLGQGGMGSVWAAVHETLGREVAVKFLQPQSGHSAVLADRFTSEAHMVASIKHRFVVDVFDFGVTEDGLHYMVLELLHGQSLADRMDHGPPLSVKKGVQLMADCLRGLHVVHEAGIVHRDLKPDNIFVMEDADGAFPKLIDFGISRRTDPPNLKLDPSGTRKSRLTLPGTVLGTPYYMSPEQLRGKESVGRRSDVYSVGVILYELLAGRLPFRQDNVGDLMVAITVKGPPSLMSSRPDLGEELAAVVKRALAPVAEERYATALELRDALIAALPSLPDDAHCAVQLANDDESHALAGDTSLQLAAAKSPFVNSLPAPISPRGVLARVPRLAWALLGVGLLVGAALLLTRHDEPASVAAPAVSAQLTAAKPLPPVPEVEPPAPLPAPPPAAAVAPAAPVTPRAAAPAERPTKASRAKSRREPSAHSPAVERPQKLYKKLDF